MRNLIRRPTSKRQFGFDTINAALGCLPGSENSDDPGTALQLMRTEYIRLMRLLGKGAAKQSSSPMSVSIKVNDVEILQTVTVACSRDDASEAGDVEATREFELRAKSKATGHGTVVRLRLQKDLNNAYWLNVRGNPTSLINGYNAFAVAAPGLKRRQERALLFRLPFDMVAAVLQKIDGTFRWEKETARRIRSLRFRVCPLQVFTYAPTAPFPPTQFLGFVRAFLACPLGNGAGNYVLVSDLLEIDVDARVANDQVQSLLLRFRQAGRISWSVNLYDKGAAVAAHAAKSETTVEEQVEQFLRSHVRVDVTLHDDALRDLLAKAKVSTKREAMLTGANINRAIGRLNRASNKKLPFVQWMLHRIFGVHLPLLTLLNYRRSLVEEVRTSIAKLGDEAAEVFGKWKKHGFAYSLDDTRLSFEQFGIKQCKLSRQPVRSVKKRALAKGLDLDIPLAVYDALFTMRHYFDLSEADRRALAVALERKDTTAQRRLMGRSAAHTSDTAEKLSKMMGDVMRLASVPAARIGAAKNQAK